MISLEHIVLASQNMMVSKAYLYYGLTTSVYSQLWENCNNATLILICLLSYAHSYTLRRLIFPYGHQLTRKSRAAWAPCCRNPKIPSCCSPCCLPCCQEWDRAACRRSLPGCSIRSVREQCVRFLTSQFGSRVNVHFCKDTAKRLQERKNII